MIYSKPKFLFVSWGVASIFKSCLWVLSILFSICNPISCYADSCNIVNVGASYGDGTVFCVSNTSDTSQCVTSGAGYYGLFMANDDQVNYDSNVDHGVTWASVGTATDATSESDGVANTVTIIAALPYYDNPSNNAAWLCHDYTGGGYADWYLPAKNELKKMYLYAMDNKLIERNCIGSKSGGVQCLIGGYQKNYWSSTEYSSFRSSAWEQLFSINNGAQLARPKVDNWFGVRAIRAFNHSDIQLVNYLTDVSKLGYKNSELKFTALDFTDNFSNSCGNSLAKIKITSLPANGVLKLVGASVSLDDEIAVTDLANLTYEPNNGYVGNDSFNWNGYDGFVYSENDANVNIAVVGMDSSIVSGSGSSSEKAESMDSSMISGSSSSSGKTENMDVPIILGLSSNSGKIGSEVAITINGSNFIDGAMKSTVKLMNGNEVINAVVTNVVSNQIICNIDLTGVSLAQIGPWDLVVTNPDGQSATLQDGFTIESGVEPIVSEITTEITDNILTITIGGSNFLVGITGVQVELTNGTDVIIAVIQTVTDGQIVCVVDVGSNPGVLVGEWAVQVTNADEKKSNEKTIRPKGMVSYSSSNGADKSWILPTAIAVPAGVVAIAAATASCLVLHKRHACCFRNGDKGNGATMEVNMAAPVYD